MSINPPPPPPPLSKEGLAYLQNLIMIRKRREQEADELTKPRGFKKRLLMIRDVILFIMGIVLFSWVMTMAMQKQAEDVSAWAKDFDYRHCWGKFDTQACHERKAAGNQAAYEKYVKENK